MNHFKVLCLGFLMLVAGSLPAMAWDTPQALIKSLYGPYLDDEISDDEMAYFSDRTQAIWQALIDEDPYGLGFSPIVDGQDFALSAFEAYPPVGVDNGSEVRVEFLNFGEPRSLVYLLVEQDEGWRIEDIRAEHGDVGWTLLGLLGAE